MSYFDGLVNGGFKKDAQGRDLFFPWGLFGGGFVLQSPAQKVQILRIRKRSLIVFFAALSLAFFGRTVWLMLLPIPLYLGWECVYIRKLTQNLERSDESISLSESWRASAKSHSLLSLIVLGLASLTFTVLGIEIMKTPNNFWEGLACVVLFGFATAVFSYTIAIKFTNK